MRRRSALTLRERASRQWTAYRRALRRDDGYVLAITALLLLPLLAFTAYAVDLGAWQARGAQLQRAADAAALAGAPEMPDIDDARIKALDTLRRNGYVNGQDGIAVTVGEVAGSENRLRVTVTDTDAAQYFSANFRDGVSIERRATAQKLKDIPMGSPRNYLGTNNSQPDDWREGFALALAGYCTSKEQGDRIMSVSDWNYASTWNGTGNWQSCSPGSPSHVKDNPTYDENGYVYAVSIPEWDTSTHTLHIEGNSLASCATNASGSDTANDAEAAGRGSANWAVNAQEMVIEVRRADDPNPHNGSLVPTTTPPSITQANSFYCGNTNQNTRWREIATVQATGGDKFYVITKSPNDVGNPGGNNQFSLRAHYGTFSPCTNDTADVNYSATTSCPNVFAVSHLGNYLNTPSSDAVFYLASIPQDYSNHQLEVYLWDPGEGAKEMELLDPNGNPADFVAEIACQDDSFRTTCPGETPPSGGVGPISDDSLWLGDNVDYCAERPATNIGSCRLYNDRLVRLTVDLPDDINTAYGGATWWKVKYYSASGVTRDRTTWSIKIKGDPVRLVPNE